MSMRPGTLRLTGLAMATALVAVGCSSKKTSSVTPAPASPSPSTSPAPVLCPLTNLAASGGDVPNRPVFAVKMPNDPTARGLQVGPESADIVYEEPVEGGITRWILLFQCQDTSRIEPVRSSRFVDIQVLAQFGKPIFGHAGGIGPVLDALKSANLIDADYSTSKFATDYHRDSSHPAPNNLYTATPEIYATAGSSAGTAPSPVFSFHDFTAGAGAGAGSPAARPAASAPAASASAPASAPPAAGAGVSSTATGAAPGATVKVPFSAQPFNVTWTWDPTKNQYLRNYDSGKTEAPAKLATGAQIATNNVIVEQVSVAPGPYVEDATGTHENDVGVVGTGKAIVCRLGNCVVGTWSRPNVASVTRYLDPQGLEIALTPGQSWVELEPNGQTPSTS